MSARKIRVVQWGTKHAHARGWLEVILANSDVELVGIVEADSERRQELEAQGDSPWANASWLGPADEVLGDDQIDAVVG